MIRALCLLALSATVSAAAPPRPALQVARHMEAPTAVVAAPKKRGFLQAAGALDGIDVPLLCYFAFWYLGNYYYTISNKRALIAGGGKAGFPMTISTLQL